MSNTVTAGGSPTRCIPPRARQGASHEDAALHPHPLELHPTARPRPGPGSPPRSAPTAAATRPLGVPRSFPPTPPPLRLPRPTSLVSSSARLAGSKPSPSLGPPPWRYPPVVSEKHADPASSATEDRRIPNSLAEAVQFGDRQESLLGFPWLCHTVPASHPGERPRSSPAPTGARTICRSKT